MTFEDYLKQIWATDFNGLREGQRAFNLLSLYRPRIAERIRNTELDPFFDDSILPAFFAVVEGSWEE